MPAASAFADHALHLQWSAIPAQAQDCARAFLLDTIAVGVAGIKAAFADEVLGALSSPGQARVFGRDARVSTGSAAFLNAYQIHAQEFDCVHEAAVLHPLSALLGAMSAVCTSGVIVDGATFGAALVAGVDIAVSLGLAASGRMKFFRPAIAGIFGATAAVARLRGLDHGATVAAFGHALSFASGTMQAHLEATPGLALQVANAARNAVLAVDLAQAGIPGAAGSIDGPFGYFSAFEDSHDLAPLLAGLGKDFAVTALSHKPFPTGRAGHGGIGAVQRLLAGGVAPQEIEALRYVAPPLIFRLVGRPALSGMGVAYARLCLPYLAAVTARRGTVGLDAFSAQAMSDPGALALAARVSVLADANPDPTAFVPAKLEATLRDGRQVTIAVDTLLGSPSNPLDAAARQAKVEACLTFGGLPNRAGALAARVTVLPSEPDMAELFALASS